jgi:hypothetical protein
LLCILSRLTFTFADPVIEPKVKLPPALLLVLSVTVMRFIE